MKPVLPWSVAAVIVLLGWYSGSVFWHPPSDADQFRTYFDVFAPFLTLLVGLPLSVSAGLLVGRGDWRSVIGYTLLVVGSIAMAYTTSIAFFGGLCIDPGDACVTSWPSRIAAVLVGVGSLATGYGLSARRGARI